MTQYPQPSYVEHIGIAYVGMIANQEDPKIISRTVEDSGGIAFGIAVFQGVNDNGVTATPSTAQKFRGITVKNDSLEPTDLDTYVEGATAGIIDEGVIWVIASVAVNATDPVFVVTNGAFSNVTSEGAVELPRGAAWDSSTTTVGALAKVRLY